jgi:hypothetical protein
MAGICHAVIFIRVTGIAVGGSSSINPAEMTVTALDGSMGSRKGKRGRRMVEGCGCPCRRAVTRRAILGESSRGMVGIGRSVVLTLMARNAGYGQTRVLAAAMAVRTLQTPMGPRKRKRRCRMVEGCGCPCRRAVTRRAILRESGRGVVGISRAVILSLMARNAGNAQPRVLATPVAIGTLEARVSSRKRKFRSRMSKECRNPRRCAVAY